MKLYLFKCLWLLTSVVALSRADISEKLSQKTATANTAADKSSDTKIKRDASFLVGSGSGGYHGPSYKYLPPTQVASLYDSYAGGHHGAGFGNSASQHHGLGYAQNHGGHVKYSGGAHGFAIPSSYAGGHGFASFGGQGFGGAHGLGGAHGYAGNHGGSSGHSYVVSHGASGLGSSGHGSLSHGSSGYGSLSHGSSGHGASGHGSSGHGASGHGSSGHGASAHGGYTTHGSGVHGSYISHGSAGQGSYAAAHGHAHGGASFDSSPSSYASSGLDSSSFGGHKVISSVPSYSLSAGHVASAAGLAGGYHYAKGLSGSLPGASSSASFGNRGFGAQGYSGHEAHHSDHVHNGNQEHHYILSTTTHDGSASNAAAAAAGQGYHYEAPESSYLPPSQHSIPSNSYGVPIASYANKYHGQSGGEDSPVYAAGHKGLGHFSYTASKPNALHTSFVGSTFKAPTYSKVPFKPSTFLGSKFEGSTLSLENHAPSQQYLPPSGVSADSSGYDYPVPTGPSLVYGEPSYQGHSEISTNQHEPEGTYLPPHEASAAPSANYLPPNNSYGAPGH